VRFHQWNLVETGGLVGENPVESGGVRWNLVESGGSVSENPVEFRGIQRPRWWNPIESWGNSLRIFVARAG